MDGDKTISSARKVMLISALLGGLVAMLGSTLPDVVAASGLDVVLTTEEIHTPELYQIALKVFRYEAEHQSGTFLVFTVIGAALCGVNLFGLWITSQR